MQTMAEGQVSAHVVFNEAMQTLEHQQVYGRRHATTTGLTWGYYGGRWAGASISDGTLSLTGSATNYVVCARATGALSVSTGTTNWNKPTQYARVYKLTTSSTAVTGVEDHRAGPGGVHGPNPFLVWVAVSDESTALTTGTAKLTFRMPFAFRELLEVLGSLTTAQSSGSTLTIDVNEGGASILSTKLTFDNGERTTTTAATPAVISDAAIAFDAEMTVDIDTVGDGTAAGLKLCLVGY